MKEQLEQQIADIANLPEWVKNFCGLETFGLKARKVTVKDLAHNLRKELNQLNFETYNSLQSAVEQRTLVSMRYNLAWPSSNLPERAWPQAFHLMSLEQQAEIKKIIFFEALLRAAHEFYKKLGNLKQNDLSTNAEKIFSASLHYLEALDRLSYKAHPIAFRTLQFLWHLGLSLAISSAFEATLILSIVIAGLIAGSWMVFPLTAPLTITLAVAFLLFSFGSSLVFLGRAENVFGGPLPEYENYSITGLKDGDSFRIMDQFGFFPFKETVTKATEIVDKLKNDIVDNKSSPSFSFLKYYSGV